MIGPNSSTVISNNGLNITSSSLGNAMCEISAAGLYIRTNSDDKTISTPMVFGSLTTGIGTNTTYMNTNGLYVWTDGRVSLHSNQSIMIVADAVGSTLNLLSDGAMNLFSPSGITLGSSNNTKITHYLYGTWKLNGTATVTSDRNLKHDIVELDDQYADLFDQLQPVKFKYNDGTSNRYHTGFIAQDVCSAIENAGLSTNDFAAYVKLTEPNADSAVKEEYGLRYDEFVSLNTWQIQKLKPRMTAAEQEIASLKLEIQSLRAELENLKNS
jgi:hypothetical protein